jgi:hypothetical protein
LVGFVPEKSVDPFQGSNNNSHEDKFYLPLDKNYLREDKIYLPEDKNYPREDKTYLPEDKNYPREDKIYLPEDKLYLPLGFNYLPFGDMTADSCRHFPKNIPKTDKIYIFDYFFYIFFCIIKNSYYICAIILNHKE